MLAGVRSVKVGLCGFTIAIGQYPRHFPVVEVQQTFYQPPSEGVMRRWRANTPPGFEFTMKAWQLVTHAAASPTYRRLKRPLTATERAGAGFFRDSAIVEEGWTEHEAARLVAREYLAPFAHREVDTLVLGCTHYPLLKPLIREVVGPSVHLIDSAEETAADTRRMLVEHDLMADGDGVVVVPREHATEVAEAAKQFLDMIGLERAKKRAAEGTSTPQK